MKNIPRSRQPTVKNDIVKGLEALNCVPMPEIGISNRIVPDELKKTPDQSTFRNLVLTGSSGMFDFGSTKKSTTAVKTVRGAMNQKVTRQVVVRMNRVARNGPIVFPAPTQDPKMP